MTYAAATSLVGLNGRSEVSESSEETIDLSSILLFLAKEAKKEELGATADRRCVIFIRAAKIRSGSGIKKGL